MTMTSCLRAAGAVLFAVLALPGVALEAQKSPGPAAGPYDVKGLGLGRRATVVVAFAADDCGPCRNAIPFYKELLKMPGMDGTTRRLVVVAMDGVWPVKDIADKHGFEPHRLTSGPYPARKLPGVTKAPTVLVLDEKGVQVGRWEGALSAAQQKEIIAAAGRR